jgi:hypothetical protein
MGQYELYEIRSGRTVVGTRHAVSAREAALDYLRARGCSRDEIAYHGADGATWRGAVYRASLSNVPPQQGTG